MVGNTRVVTRKMVSDRAMNVMKHVKKEKSSTLAVMKTENENMQKRNAKKVGAKVKRMAQNSPNEAPQKKRSAFGDITNAANIKGSLAGKKLKATKSTTSLSKTIPAKQHAEDISKEISSDNAKINSGSTNSSSQEQKHPSFVENKKESSTNSFENDSLESNLSEDDLFKLSSDGLSSSQEIVLNIDSSADTVILSDLSDSTQKNDNRDTEDFNIPEVVKNLPEGVRDVDNDKDPFNVCEYAYSIFKNMKARERLFPVRKYLDDRKDITAGMRAILIDWLVEVQENFELYHETLYLAVRIIDLYLQKKECKRANLQLIGATAMFIASKIEERHAPPLDDFVFVCDDAYKSSKFINMEIDILSTLDFELGLPISYRFLRRYARVAGSSMETLTLARYILESSLLEYDFVDCSQSRIAAAALNLAFKMKKSGTWDKTLEYHSGYNEDNIKDIVTKLNSMLNNIPKKNLSTIHVKYSHPVFSEVAKIPLIKIQ